MLNDLRLSRAPAAALAAIGAFWGNFAAWLPQIKAQAGVGDARFGALMVLSAVGGMAAMALVPRLDRALGPVLLPLGAGLLAMVVFLPVGITGPVSFALTMLAVGASMSLIDIAANLRIADLETRHARPLMNLNHAVFSLSLAGAAGLAGAIRGFGAGYWTSALAMMMILACLGLLTVDLRAAPAPAPQQPGAQPTPRGLPWAVVLPAAAILFLSFVAENGTESWSALHFERSLGVAAGHSAFGPAMFALTMGIGRLMGQALAIRLGEARLILASVLFAVLGALAVSLAPVAGVALAGMAALGLGVAVVVPSANSLLARGVAPEVRALSIARAWMIGFTGFFVGPPLLGLVAEGASLRWAFAAIALLLVLILPALARLNKAGKSAI
ncbi:MFS transporter [Paracoccus sp. p4-l81]|uniref:MFS transporter n=1 Tax=unclassified Paracoccus (in: a-proteobacteria) TaxID=2688777 RepID=UPI0035BA03F9